MSRLPIRWRLTLAFALALTLLIFGFGILLRQSLATALDSGVTESLRARADEIGALVQSTSGEALAGVESNRLSESEESFAQVLDGGTLVGSSSPFLAEPVLSPEQIELAMKGPLAITIPEREGLVHRARVLARPVDDGRLVVVGVSLEDRDETIRLLTVLMLIGGPVIILLLSGLGYALASAALRPVATMREHAAAILGAPDGARLPLPEAEDDIRRLGETLNGMLERIDVVLERERAFVADASHELRTPLGILKAEIELALTGERSHAELRRALVSAAEETEHLVRLAEDLLVLSRAECDGIAISRESVALADELALAVGPFRSQAERDGRSIRLDVEPGAEANVDRMRLRQAVGNLVDNALLHGEGLVVVRAHTSGEGIEVEVQDDGAGFPEAFAPEAFKRFTRAGAGRSGRGAGLGLAIVAAIAEAHGGHARLGSNGQAVVSLTLPSPA